MIPYIFAAVGGYLIGDSLKGQNFAKGGKVDYVENDPYDQKYFRRFNNAIGAFAWKYNGNYNEGILYPLDSFDKQYYSHVALKKDEVLLRYRTDRMVKDAKYLIKFNLDKALIYFMSDSDSDDDKNPKFETRGIKAEYIVISKDYAPKQYAYGGEIKIGNNFIIKSKNEFPYHVVNENGAVRYKAKSFEDAVDWAKSRQRFDEGGMIEKYLSSRSEMFTSFDNALSKKDVIDFIAISKNSDKKYWIKDSNGYSNFLYKGQLRANDSTSGIFEASKISVDKLKDSLKYKIREEDLYDYEKEMIPYLDEYQNIKKPNPIENDWTKYVKENKSYFSVEEETENRIQLATRQNGNVGDEEPSSKDIKEAKEIYKKVKSKYPNTKGSIETVDEWVYLELENGNYSKGGTIEEQLEKIDVYNDLDEYEYRHYIGLKKHSDLSKVDALKIIINDAEGDISQLSKKLASIAKKIKYADGGRTEPKLPHRYKIGDKVTFMNADYSTGRGKIVKQEVRYINMNGYNLYLVELDNGKINPVAESDILDDYSKNRKFYNPD